MKIDIEKCIKSPFLFEEGVSPTVVFLIAAVLSLIAGFNFSFSYNFNSMPDLSILYKDALENPATPFIFIVLFILVLLVVVAKVLAGSFLQGYIIETVKNEFKSASFIMPGWGKNLKAFFWNGFRWQLVKFCYVLIIFLFPILFFILLLLFSGINFSNIDSIKDAQGFFLFCSIIILMIILFGVFFLYMFILPFMFMRYIENNSFFSAFNLPAIVKSIVSNFLDYILAILVGMLVLVASAIISIGLCLTCVGILFIPLVGIFISQIIIFNLFAQAYKN